MEKKLIINSKKILCCLLLFLFISIELQLYAILDLYLDFTIYVFLVRDYLIHIDQHKL